MAWSTVDRSRPRVSRCATSKGRGNELIQLRETLQTDKLLTRNVQFLEGLRRDLLTIFHCCVSHAVNHEPIYNPIITKGLDSTLVSS